MDDQSPIVGLTSAEVQTRISEGRVNVNMELKTKSVKELFLENLCTVFNLVNFVLAFFVLLTGSFKNLSFLIIVVLNTGIGVVQSVRSKRMVDKLTLLATKKAHVVRDSAELELDLDQIVIDDIVHLGRGDQIPADAVVVSGEASVNESLLTGESDLIKKGVGSQLMSGSFIDSGTVLARVIHVGADNYVAKINNEAKYVKKVNSEIMNSLNAIVRFASVVMIPLGLALLISSLNTSFEKAGSPGGSLSSWVVERILSGHPPTSELLSMVGALLGMIPQGLVLLTSSVLAIATIRLARRRVLVQQLYCIETLARVDVLCLDKTGTITSGHMEVAGTHGLCAEGETADVPAPDELEFALANIARASESDPNETSAALLAYYVDSAVPTSEPIRMIPFSSAKKWSGATFTEGSYVMGAAQFILDPVAFSLVEAQANALASSCRVLLVAEVDGFNNDGDIQGTPRPLGFVTIRDEIRASAKDTIAFFNEQGVALNVISGDDPRTVSSIARYVGVPGADAYVDATTLDTPAKIDAAVDKYHVFGRVTPQQKREFVQAFKRRGHTVAMTGDGVNDVLALKESDCSVAMAAGSDAARNVAEIVLVDNDFASMPAVVAEGRRSINNLQRSAALFLTKTLFSMGLAAICIAFPPYPFEPIQMTLINFFCIGAPGFVLGLEPNRALVKGRFLSNVLKKALPASLFVILAACLNIFFARVFNFSSFTLSTMCLVTSASVSAALIFRISRPFTPLRACLFAFVCIGLSVGIIGFPSFFSIAELSLQVFLLLAVIVLASVSGFFKLAEYLSSKELSLTRPATGFGRGIRVRYKRGAKKVSSTGSDLRRFIVRVSNDLQERSANHEEKKAVRDAERDAERVVLDSRKAKSKRVVQVPDGIRVHMPAKRKQMRR